MGVKHITNYRNMKDGVTRIFFRRDYIAYITKSTHDGKVGYTQSSKLLNQWVVSILDNGEYKPLKSTVSSLRREAIDNVTGINSEYYISRYHILNGIYGEIKPIKQRTIWKTN